MEYSSKRKRTWYSAASLISCPVGLSFVKPTRDGPIAIAKDIDQQKSRIEFFYQENFATFGSSSNS